MALPTADSSVAALPAPRRWRPGLALVALAVVVWAHWSLIRALAPAAAPPGGPPRPAAALQVRRLAPPLPAPILAAAVTPVVPARPPTSPPTKPLTKPLALAPPEVRAAVMPLRLADASPRAAASAEGVPRSGDGESPPTEAPEPAAAPEGDPPPPVYPTQLPAPVRLRYALRYNGQVGEALLTWRHDGARYTLALEGRGGPGDRPLVAQASQGVLDGAGLAPERHLDRRRGGRQHAANFRRDIGRIGFSGPAVDYPAWPGAQDRLSWLAQLAAILGAGHAGSELRLFVVDARGAGSLWRLQRQPDERLDTPLGEVLAQSWRRDPPRPEGLLVQAWLDVHRGHWPVQLRFTAPRSGDVFELRLLDEPQAPP